MRWRDDLVQLFNNVGGIFGTNRNNVPSTRLAAVCIRGGHLMGTNRDVYIAQERDTDVYIAQERASSRIPRGQ